MCRTSQASRTTCSCGAVRLTPLFPHIRLLGSLWLALALTPPAWTSGCAGPAGLRGLRSLIFRGQETVDPTDMMAQQMQMGLGAEPAKAIQMQTQNLELVRTPNEE